ncbi:MAG: efflux RND transporter periplasmic adaptor subunit [Acidobacteriota bacterium]
MANNHRSSKRRRWILIGAAVLGLGVSVFAVANVLRPDNTIDPSKLAEVKRGDIAQSVVATGKVEPLTKVEIKSKASGIVQKIFVDYGDRVTVGQVMLELDKEQLRARVKEVEANLQASQATVQSAQAIYQRNIIDAQGPDIPFLKATLDRNRKLAAEGLIPDSSLDDAKKAYEVARNKQMSARRNVAVSKADIARARAQVSQAQASLDQAKEDLQNSTIVSPINGLVLSRDVEVGDAVSSILVLGSQATQVFTVGNMSTVYVLGKVDQADIGKVYLGQEARIRVESFPKKIYDGKVTKISPMGVEKDNVTTFEVRVSIQNPTGELKANMSANAELIIQEKHNVLIVPETAVVYDKDHKTFAEIPAQEAKLGWKKVPIQIGISNGINAEVESGLKQGQQVILQ